MIAAGTQRRRMSNDIAVLPLYHAILAEEMPVLDNISGAPMELGQGIRYVRLSSRHSA